MLIAKQNILYTGNLKQRSVQLREWNRCDVCNSNSVHPVTTHWRLIPYKSMLHIMWSEESNIGITWVLARNADSQAPPRPTNSESAF